MKKRLTLPLILSAICLWMPITNSAQAAANGEELFKQRCSVCHPNGGNVINPKETLHKGEREVNTVEEIVGKMRNPGPGMSKFDSKSLPDSDAKAIAEYILKTF